MNSLRSIRFGALLLLAFGGCSSSSTSPGDDCASNPAKCGCADDGQCAAPTPRCDARTRACVPCLPTTDNCPPATHCVNDGKEYRCVARDKCIAAADCPEVAGRAGLCCEGTCADPVNDASNCGTCGTTCGNVPNGTGGCVDGACGIAQCNGGFGNCDGKVANGCEADTTGNVEHCGVCGAPCKKAPNSAVSCVAGKCVFQCSAGFDDCDANPGNGCETSTTTNAMNCGGCGKVCGNLPNAATVACSASMCVVETCAAPFSDCNHLPGDGCESDSKSDPMNCNGCGRKCPAIDHGAPGCAMGSCGVGQCNAGFGDCDGNVLNGCEQDLSADKNNCGACGTVCKVANGVPDCRAGACLLQACNQGWEDCDMKLANGCEAPTSRDLLNCGACGNACPVPANATASCSFGVCGVGSCKYGFADCNKDLSDGCEVNVLQVNDCGACGVMCAVPPNGVATCGGAVCALGMCNAGFADCDKKLPNGCEIALTTDVNNCGACGVVCPSKFNQAATCAAGKCGLGACLQNFVDCNKNPADGCEIDISANGANCGSCGFACVAPKPYCLGGVCADVAKNCLIIKKSNPNSADGAYSIDPDGAGPIALQQVYCDMTSDGGGWTIVYASAAADNEVGMSSDVAAGGNPLAFAYYNQNRAMKMALSAISQESLFRRKDGAWIKANAALYDNLLATPNSHLHVLVTLTSSDGQTAQGALGYSNYNTSGGGDYGVSMFPDAATCNGSTVNGFDHHSGNYWHLNCGCQRQYLYSYSSGVLDGDQQYQINTGLGAWTITQACVNPESGGLSFYAAMR